LHPAGVNYFCSRSTIQKQPVFALALLYCN
jgi:hypothetical protein